MAKFLNFVNEHALWKSLKNINIQEKVMSLNLDYI